MSSQRSGSTLLCGYQSLSREDRALTHPTTALSHFFTQLGRCLTPSSVTVFSHFCKKTISLASISLAFCLSSLRPCSSSSLLNNGYAVWKQGHMTTAVFMDFRKAFDKVWHRGPLYKLTTAGVSLSSVSWLSDYLSSRTINCC